MVHFLALKKYISYISLVEYPTYIAFLLVISIFKYTEFITKKDRNISPKKHVFFRFFYSSFLFSFCLR